MLLTLAACMGSWALQKAFPADIQNDYFEYYTIIDLFRY